MKINKTDIFIILLLCLLFIFAIDRKIKLQKLANNFKYTFCTTTYTWRSYNVKNVSYDYFVDNKKYTNERHYNYKIVVPGGRYLVKFSIEDPSIHEVYFDCWVPHELETPKNGWDSIPSLIKCHLTERTLPE